MRRPVTVIVVGVIKTVAGAKEQTGDRKESSKNEQDKFNIHNDYSFYDGFLEIMV